MPTGNQNYSRRSRSKGAGRERCALTALRLQRQPGIEIARTVGVSRATLSTLLAAAGSPLTSVDRASILVGGLQMWDLIAAIRFPQGGYS